jgi:hypothetical protein
MKKQSLEWESVVDRVSCETSPVAEPPPFGFATWVVSAWRVARRDEGLRRWTRWSLRAALGSVALCMLLLALSARDDDAPILLRPPTTDLVTPAFPNR